VPVENLRLFSNAMTAWTRGRRLLRGWRPAWSVVWWPVVVVLVVAVLTAAVVAVGGMSDGVAVPEEAGEGSPLARERMRSWSTIRGAGVPALLEEGALITSGSAGTNGSKKVG
jgi:hypothetical protein